MGIHADWNVLAGREVQVQKDGRTIRTGHVEAVSVTADALWIAAYGVEPRALDEKSQGHVVLPVSEQTGQAVGTGADVLIELRVNDRAAMDRCLDAAVDRIIAGAVRDPRHGILVTRLADGHFTVGLSDEVPFGYTQELDARNRSF